MTTEKYTNTAVLLHWIMAILIICMIVMGMYMEDLPKGTAERTWWFTLHKSIGLTLGLLAIARLGWKIFNPAPALPDFVKASHRKISTIVHHSLYLLLFLQPLTGYISSSFSGYKTKFWGIPLYHWGWKSPELNEFFTNLHEFCAVLLIALIGLHIVGFAMHMKNGEYEILKRMWFIR